MGQPTIEAARPSLHGTASSREFEKVDVRVLLPGVSGCFRLTGFDGNRRGVWLVLVQSAALTSELGRAQPA